MLDHSKSYIQGNHKSTTPQRHSKKMYGQWNAEYKTDTLSMQMQWVRAGRGQLNKQAAQFKEVVHKSTKANH